MQKCLAYIFKNVVQNYLKKIYPKLNFFLYIGTLKIMCCGSVKIIHWPAHITGNRLPVMQSIHFSLRYDTNTGITYHSTQVGKK
jgi:hypothetical protein